MDAPVQAQQPAQQPAQPGAQPDKKLLQTYIAMSLAVKKKIFDQQAAKGFVELMRTAGDPAAAIAHAAFIVVNQVGQEAAAKGAPQSAANVALPIAAQEFYELGKAARLWQEDQQILQKAVELIKQQLQTKQQPTKPEAQPPENPGLINAAMPAPAGVQ